MSSTLDARAAILDAIRKASPASAPMPDIRAALAARSRPDGDLVARFTESARAAGAEVVQGSRTRVRELAHVEHTDDVLVADASFGVAENGAVWMPSSRIGVQRASRAALLLARHVLLTLDCRDIVWDLHDAYARIDLAAEPFGVFIAGPSKTADIEQSLVIGAQGPVSLTLCLVDER